MSQQARSIEEGSVLWNIDSKQLTQEELLVAMAAWRSSMDNVANQERQSVRTLFVVLGSMVGGVVGRQRRVVRVKERRNGVTRYNSCECNMRHSSCVDSSLEEEEVLLSTVLDVGGGGKGGSVEDWLCLSRSNWSNCSNFSCSCSFRS